MVISKVNDPFLILQGTQAASWLAMRGQTIGLASPARYVQEEDEEIFKLNHEICVVTGSKIIKKIEQNWEKSVPDGIVLHRLNAEQVAKLNALMQART